MKVKSDICEIYFKNQRLPYDLKMIILSYLYFSDEISFKIKFVNNNIKQYNIYELKKLICKYDITIVSYYILKYFLYDSINSVKLFVDYTMLSKPSTFQTKELKRIFNNLRIVDVLRIRKYVDKKGKTSEFYVD